MDSSETRPPAHPLPSTASSSMFKSIALSMPDRYAQHQATTAASGSDEDEEDFLNYYGESEHTTQSYFKQLTSDSVAEMSGIEETLEYFDWTGRDSSRGLEQQIIQELQLVNMAIVHSMIEPDERTRDLMTSVDKAIADCWDLEKKLTVYQVQLGSLAENLNYLETLKERDARPDNGQRRRDPRQQRQLK